MIKAFGQLLIAGFFMQIFPVDAAYYEAVINDTTVIAGLPMAEQRIVEPVETVMYPKKIDPYSLGIVTTAESGLVLDDASDMMLYAEHPDQVRSIGSVTKLMTALVFLDQNPNLDAWVQLDASQDYIVGGRLYLLFDDPILLRDLFAVSLIGSDNAATHALMRLSGLTEEEFVDRMNQKAQEIGMTNSYFVDPTGIRAGNLSTARDLVQLLRASEEQELIRTLTTTSKKTVYHQNGTAVTVHNTNPLLDGYLNDEQYQIVAGKTGYLPQAGYVLAYTVKEGDHAIHVVVMGADSKTDREVEATGLAEWAFKTFEWPNE